MTIKSPSDIEAIEPQPLADFDLPTSTYAVLVASAKRSPDAKALSFFLTIDTYDRAETWTYAELVGEITQAANAFHSFGVTPKHPVAFVLPNLPETHFTIWGGGAAGVVFSINPVLKPSEIAQLLRVARVRVLVTLAPNPGIDLWDRLFRSMPCSSKHRSERTIFLVFGGCPRSSRRCARCPAAQASMRPTVWYPSR
jgi:fatty-acyl-CoA synthase